jgi:hypothetical protein
MPKNTVSDPITDQEMAFAHLVLSGTMNDRRAAEAVGLNPDTAAYTKAKPRVRAYMIEHRAAVEEKLVDQEAEGLRRLNIGRDQILVRLLELANLSSEATRGSIAGQVKALSMIVAIEGLIPDRRLSPSGSQPPAPPVKAEIYASQWRRQQPQAAGEQPGDSVAATEAPPAAPQAADPEPPSNPAPRVVNDEPPPPFDRNFDPSFDPNQPSLANPFTIPQPLNRVPDATECVVDAVFEAGGSSRLPFSPKRSPFARRR